MSQDKNNNRGFAAMEQQGRKDEVSEIASKGGKAAHEKGVAHEFTPEEARKAGRLGGEAVSKDRKHMSEIGKMGGEARHRSHSDDE